MIKPAQYIKCIARKIYAELEKDSLIYSKCRSKILEENNEISYYKYIFLAK